MVDSRLIALKLDKLADEPIVLLLTASELEILSQKYSSEILVLYKFAKAQKVIREATKVISWSTLDEFELYRKNLFSFYLDDGPKPNIVIVEVGGREKI